MLEKIKWPEDLKNFTNPELIQLASQMRQALITRANIVGWHFWPNLGMVEATIALHKVFNSPIDKFVFDVSHQSYPHKMLTWRMEAYTNSEKYRSVSGYTYPKESEHDHFFVWHTSTSISLATWLAKARDLKWDSENIIAIIWDGSMSGGMAYEWLNVASELNSNIIIVVNDNDMSIAENHGWLYKNLKLLRETNWKAENNFFTSLWLEYYFIKDWHNFEELLDVFSKVKDTKKPVVVHMCTIKWKWSEFGEINKEAWHYIMPWMASPDFVMPTNFPESYSSITANYILEKIKEDKTIIAISPATPMLNWFDAEFRKKAWINYIDVGIAEEQAVTMASAIAKNGWKPILWIWSTFIQRAYDQLSHDLALNSNSATILVTFTWINWGDATHLWIFDIPLISNIPNMVYLAPTTKEEYLKMLDWSVNQNIHPVAIRIPAWNMISSWVEDKTDYSNLNKFQLVESWNEVAIIALWSYFYKWIKLKEKLKETWINATLINPKFITWIDKELLESLKLNHKLIITLEDWVLDWGFGEKITRFYGNSDMKVLNYWARKEFTDRIPLDKLLEELHLTPDLILTDIKEIL